MTRAAAAVTVVAVLGLGAFSCQGGSPGITAGPGPTLVVAGEAVPVRRMTDAVAGLCAALDEAPDNPRAAEATFFDRSHDTLHTIARALEDMDRPLAAGLLEAKQRVEGDFSGGLASGPRVADDLGRLVDATRAGLARLEVPAQACDK